MQILKNEDGEFEFHMKIGRDYWMELSKKVTVSKEQQWKLISVERRGYSSK